MVIASITANGSLSSSTRSLKVPGLALVRVAHHVVRHRRLPPDRVPLAGRRERGAATSQQARRGHFGDHALGAELDGSSQRPVSSGRAIAVEAGGIGLPHARQQPGRTGASDDAERQGRGRSPCRARTSASASLTGRDHEALDGGTGAQHQRGGAGVALPQARRSLPCHGGRLRMPPRHHRSPRACVAAGTAAMQGWPQPRLELAAQALGAAQPAGDVVAHVRHHGRAWLRGEQVIEREHAPRLGRAAPTADGRCSSSPRARSSRRGPARRGRPAAAGAARPPGCDRRRRCVHRARCRAPRRPSPTPEDRAARPPLRARSRSAHRQ